MDISITFDIETIPWQKQFTAAQQDLFNKEFTETKTKKYGEKELSEEELNDLEILVKSVNPYLGEIVVIGIYITDNKREELIALDGNEFDILSKFWNIIDGFNGTFVSFNGLQFDVPFIIKRSMYHNIKPTNNNFLNLRKYSTYPHFDVKYIMGNFNTYAIGTLDQLCDFLNIESPKNGDVKADSVFLNYIEGKIKLIKEYCLRDVKATYECYKRIKNYQYNIFIK